MGARKPQATRLSRFARGRRFDRNPLRRASDRIETMLLAALVIAFLAGTPLAVLGTGAWVGAMARQAQLSQQASRLQVPAVVVSAATPGDIGRAIAYQAQARWQAPDGRTVTGQVPVPSGTTVGTKTQVWIDRTGAVTSAPLLDSQVAEQQVLGQALGGLAAVSGLTLAGLLGLGRLNQRRLADWDADWQVTEPRWTTHA